MSWPAHAPEKAGLVGPGLVAGDGHVARRNVDRASSLTRTVGVRRTEVGVARLRRERQPERSLRTSGFVIAYTVSSLVERLPRRGAHRVVDLDVVFATSPRPDPCPRVRVLPNRTICSRRRSSAPRPASPGRRRHFLAAVPVGSCVTRRDVVLLREPERVRAGRRPRPISRDPGRCRARRRAPSGRDVGTIFSNDAPFGRRTADRERRDEARE